jgi:L-amino acid N-acyltransferase YncA
MPRELVLDDRRQPTHLDLLALLDGEPAGVASTEIFGGAPNGDLAFVTIRVPRENRRRGIGTALHRAASEHARTLGKSRFYCVMRADDADSLGYYGALGYEEVGRMQDAYLDLAAFEDPPPAGFEIVPIGSELERAVYEVALEADADVPSGTEHESGTFEQWHARHFGSEVVLRDLSFAALEDGKVLGYTILGVHDSETAGNWMTGVARSARGRGVALALKRHQAAAARAAGWRGIRTQNDYANLPMLRVNERLGFLPLFEWVHLTGPLIG